MKNNYETATKIEELKGNPEFIMLATEYLDILDLMKNLQNEACAINKIPITTQLIIDKILYYQTSLLKVENELTNKGFSKKDVFKWGCENIIKQ